MERPSISFVLKLEGKRVETGEKVSLLSSQSLPLIFRIFIVKSCVLVTKLQGRNLIQRYAMNILDKKDTTMKIYLYLSFINKDLLR